MVPHDRQTTHLACVHLKHFCDFLSGVWGLLPVVFPHIKGPKHPLKKTYSKCFKQTQIGQVIWRSLTLTFAL